MKVKKGWTLKGIRWECCRMEGHCSIWFGREPWEPCKNFATYQITEGQCDNIDMAGVTFIQQNDGIASPKDGGTRTEVAIYISDNATDAQRKALEASLTARLAGGRMNLLGVKTVPINVAEENGTYHISMPFGEQKIALTVGADGGPMGFENFSRPDLTNIKICNTHYWNYHDYGKNLEFRNTSGSLGDFILQGED